MRQKQEFVNTGVRFTVEQKKRLDELAKQLRVSPNATMGMLVDNAVIEPVQRHEPVARLALEAM